jgi:tetratricopeptide (TPR) repeat protein
MDESLHNNETILDYIDGMMNPGEKAAFEKQLEQDPGLQEQVESLRVAIEAVKQSGTRERVGAIHQEMMQEWQSQKTPARVIGINRTMRYVIGVAAVLLLIIGIQTFRHYSNSPGRLYNEAFVDYSLSAERGAGDGANQLENNYRNHDYNNVIKNAGQASLSPKDSFLTAMAFLHTGNTASAISWLELVQANSPYAKDAQFYLSLAYLKNRNYQKAIDLMLLIRNDPNHPYHDNITETLLEKTRKLQ